jgi:iron complex transport system permease protein
VNRASGVFRAYVVGVVFWVFAFILALKLGAVPDADLGVITQLRLPRAVLASAVGMGLAVAGAALQALFSNPLCDPYTLGISSGSAVGAVVGATLGLNWLFSGLAGTAFVGALIFTGFLYLLAARPGTGNLTVLLAGVMLSFLGSSLVALWMSVSDANGIQGALLWLLGDLSRARIEGAAFSIGVAGLLVSLLWSRWREMDALLMGEEGALSLGIDVAGVRRRLILLTSLLIALCVSAAGMIGFVGLVVPHFARRFVGSLHLRLIPLCAIWGAAAVTLADCLARVVVRPYELPVGVVTALFGAPIFLWVMLRTREHE